MSGRVLFSSFDVTKQVFYRSAKTFAMVNINPIVPGHVLVVPDRIVPRLKDLSGEEIADIFLTANTVGQVVEREYDAESLTIAVQDGPAAGQTVPHVHVHILPRKFTDFGGRNDEVYPAIEYSEQELASMIGQSKPERRAQPLAVDARNSQQPRTAEDMEKEAKKLSNLFSW
ncbi:HIT-like protein [Cantharellus anzutake]|uniref:HIT-like protein n=1 Tax=Cantharellus anzutake TaxID=1750568 RepID=UPI0019085210|nr:HIT-like protein [Cantharellus anzutake]KAF8336985.1 HIT-like protein [Cantharellus anzutake]